MGGKPRRCSREHEVVATLMAALCLVFVGAPAAAQPSTPSGTAGSLTPPPPRPNQLIAIDAAPFGVDPIVGRYVTTQMRETGAAMGYAVLDADKTVAAARGIAMPYPPAPADLWRVGWASGSQRAVFARIWAQGGRYIVEIIVASLDGSGPFYARGDALATELLATVDRLVRESLPVPGQWNVDAAERVLYPPARPVTAEQPLLQTPIVRARTVEEVEAARTPEQRWDLALRSEAAIGTSSDRFDNFLLGARLDFRITHSLIIGAYFGYANLRSRDGRANNLLFYGLLEDRIYVTEESRISIPLRFVFGYVPYNGPYIQLAAGVNFPVGDRVEIGLDLLAPTFWILPEERAFSMNLAAEVIYRF